MDLFRYRINYKFFLEELNMDAQIVNQFIMANAKYLPEDKIPFVKQKLAEASDDKLTLIQCTAFKDPSTLLIISIFLGYLGIDRFMLGETGMGVLKLLTGGVCGILAIIDWFTISKKTKEYNFNKLMLVL